MTAFINGVCMCLGAFATIGALSFGLWNFRLGKRKMSQKMMRMRIAAQGFTVAALISGMFMAASSTNSQGAFIKNPLDGPSKKT